MRFVIYDCENQSILQCNQPKEQVRWVSVLSPATEHACVRVFDSRDEAETEVIRLRRGLSLLVVAVDDDDSSVIRVRPYIEAALVVRTRPIIEKFTAGRTHAPRYGEKVTGNRLIVVGGIGQYHCYLNVAMPEALHRYRQATGEDPGSVREFNFVDEFGAYDAYALKE